jgi:hypothetical protein
MTRFALVLLLAVAAPLWAQGQGKDSSDIPSSHRPPPGMCRIWIDGVPAGRQPAPTDCPTAIRRRPPNARVVFGEELREPQRDRNSLQREQNDRNDRPPTADRRLPLVDRRSANDRPTTSRPSTSPPSDTDRRPTPDRPRSEPSTERHPTRVQDDKPRERERPQPREPQRQPERQPPRTVEPRRPSPSIRTGVPRPAPRPVSPRRPF